jgi:hypothetical protein
MKANMILLLLASLATGCQFIARGPEQYRDDTRTLLEGNSGSLKSCYDGVIRTDKAAAGTVTVNFTVENETGRIKDVKVDDAGSSAPQPVRDCVVNAITGLQLDPPDARDGKATFTYEFAVGGQASARAPDATTGS